MLEKTILNSLVYNEEYTRKVLPYVKAEYFQNKAEQAVFRLINDYIQKYNTLPNIATIDMELNSRKADINEFEFKEIMAIVGDLSQKQEWEISWLLDRTEKWCQEKAVYNAIIKSVNILKDNTGKTSKGAIPGLLQDALGVSFDTHIGIDLIEDANDWYERSHQPYERIPFDLDMLNKITKGGLRKKTLTILIGGVGFGKSLWMCHMAGANLLLGKKVLYISMEMSEDQVSERIYANMLNVPLDLLDNIPKDVFMKKVEALKAKTPGKLITHEYPNGGAGASNFRHLLNELKIKKNFVPDIIYVDYLNICMSNKVKFTGNMRHDLYIQYIAEEIRALAKEQNLPIVSATQVNREGFVSSDPGLENISQSWGQAATGDLILIIIVSDDLIKAGQYMVKQVKNRYSDFTKNRRFIIGVDRSKMRLFNVEDHAQIVVNDSNSEPSAITGQGSISERAVSLVKKPEFSFREFK